MAEGDGTVLIEDAQIIYRNFSGRETQYNREGDRNFSVILPDQLAEDLVKDGWNVKYRPAREEGESDLPFLQVSVKYGKGRPPRIVMITSRGRTTLYEEDVELLDWADIKTADMILNPYEWVVSGKHGIKAYLRSLFITIEEDELERKYADIDDATPSRD